MASKLSPLEQVELSDLYQQLDVAQNNLGNAQANQDDLEEYLFVEIEQAVRKSNFYDIGKMSWNPYGK